jgi:hypothetical protein
MGVAVPPGAAPGLYTGAVVVGAGVGGGGVHSRKVPLALRVSAEVAVAHGDTEQWRASRVRWLDSTLGIDDELAHPFTAMEVRVGLYPTVALQYISTTLYTRFPIILGRCVSKVTTGYHPRWPAPATMRPSTCSAGGSPVRAVPGQLSALSVP